MRVPDSNSEADALVVVDTVPVADDEAVTVLVSDTEPEGVSVDAVSEPDIELDDVPE